MDKPIIVYSAEWCSDCKRSRAFLKRHGIVYENVNVDENPEAAENGSTAATGASQPSFSRTDPFSSSRAIRNWRKSWGFLRAAEERDPQDAFILAPFCT